MSCVCVFGMHVQMTHLIGPLCLVISMELVVVHTDYIL